MVRGSWISDLNTAEKESFSDQGDYDTLTLGCRALTALLQAKYWSPVWPFLIVRVRTNDSPHEQKNRGSR